MPDSFDATNVTARLVRLESAISTMLDRDEIRDALQRYGRGVDRHDADLVESVFHDDAKIQYGPEPWTGAAAMIPQTFGYMKSEWSAHNHVIDVKYIEIDGDIAHAETVFFDMMLRTDGELADVSTGRWVDRFERRDGHWRIAERGLYLDTQGTVTAVARVPGALHGSRDRNDPSYLRPFSLGE